MNMLRNLAVASAVAVALGLGATGTATAAPAGIANIMPPAAAPSEAANLVRHGHWQRRCWPVYRWVWTHWGWRYRYVGTRCAPRRHGPYGY